MEEKFSTFLKSVKEPEREKRIEKFISFLDHPMQIQLMDVVIKSMKRAADPSSHDAAQAGMLSNIPLVPSVSKRPRLHPNATNNHNRPSKTNNQVLLDDLIGSDPVDVSSISPILNIDESSSNHLEEDTSISPVQRTSGTSLKHNDENINGRGTSTSVIDHDEPGDEDLFEFDSEDDTTIRMMNFADMNVPVDKEEEEEVRVMSQVEMEIKLKKEQDAFEKHRVSNILGEIVTQEVSLEFLEEKREEDEQKLNEDENIFPPPSPGSFDSSYELAPWAPPEGGVFFKGIDEGIRRVIVSHDKINQARSVFSSVDEENREKPNPDKVVKKEKQYNSNVRRGGGGEERIKQVPAPSHAPTTASTPMLAPALAHVPAKSSRRSSRRSK